MGTVSFHAVAEGAAPDPESAAAVERARAIILAWGSNSTAYQIINPGICRWFTQKGNGLVGFVRGGSTRVAAGEPVCEKSRLEEIAGRFERASAAEGGRSVCWFCASAMFASLLPNRSSSTILIGAQPVWNPAAWQTKIRSRASLRQQLNRARNKGVTVTEWSTEKAGDHPALLRCLEEWLEARPFPPLHFLVEPQTLHRLFDRRVFVAERSGKPIGFVVLSPVPRRNGWLAEQIIRAHGAPNGTAEMMLDTAIGTIAAEGYGYVTLGLAPLSRRAGIPSENPRWIRFLFGWIRLHGRRFYNFDGLDFFKAKFMPDYWEPIYAISSEPRFSFRTLYGVAQAFSNRSPVIALGSALLKAVRQEFRWFARRLRSTAE